MVTDKKFYAYTEVFVINSLDCCTASYEHTYIISTTKHKRDFSEGRVWLDGKIALKCYIALIIQNFIE